MLAEYLGVDPNKWDTYVRRKAIDMLGEKEIISLFRSILEYPVKSQLFIAKRLATELERERRAAAPARA